MANAYWPLFDLVVRTPRLELRPPTDDMFVELAESATPGMFPDGTVYFQNDWVSRPGPERQRSSMQWWWKQRAEWTVEKWSLGLAVMVEGRPVGVQDVGAAAFPACRSVKTGSWLAAQVQGRGYGREMRQAVLQLAFDGLGAEEALSEAHADNVRSNRVSKGVGYDDNGSRIDLRPGRQAGLVKGFRMTKERFDTIRRPDVVIENLEPCLAMFGLKPDLTPITGAPE